MPDWMERPIHQAIYSLERSLAQLTWGADRSGLAVIDLMDRFRHGLVTEGFTTALDNVAVNIVGVSRPVFELSLVLGCLLIVASPIVRFQWVNIRKVVVMALLIPVLLPLVAAKFQDIDGARGAMADTFYNHIVSNVHFAGMGGGDGGNGEADDMGPVVPFTSPMDEREGLRGVDVAAAYLYATRDDVANNRDLPAGFEQKYFPHTMEGFGGLEGDQRWDAIQTSANGITRTLYGVFLLAFAFFESLTNIAFTLALGFLLIALLISALFAFFTPFEGMFSSILKKLAELFMQSWAISAMQALLLAGVMQVATTSGGTYTLGVGIVALFLQGLFTMMAYKTVIGSVTGLGIGGGLGSFEVGRMLRPATALAGRTVGTAVDAATAAPRMAAAYGAARAQGASASFAAGYALNASKPMAAIGALAAAMGGGSRDFVAGGAQGQMARHRGQGLTSALGLDGVASHVERSQEKDHRAQREQIQEQRYQASEARREAEQPQRDDDRAYQLAERQRREEERTTKEAKAATEAPIRALGVPDIAKAVIGQVAQRSSGDKPATGQDVARALGLPPQAFGRRTAAVSALADTLHKTPIPDGLAQQLMVERGLEGGFRHETWAEGMKTLTDNGLSESAATKRMKTLESQMGAIPTSITPADLEQPTADSASPPSSAGPLRSYAPLPSEQAAQRGKTRRAGGGAPPAARTARSAAPARTAAAGPTAPTVRNPAAAATSRQAAHQAPTQRVSPPASHTPPANTGGHRQQQRRNKKKKKR